MATPLSGKVAIVTGGARGIGLATALKLSSLGSAVVLSDILDGASAVEAVQSEGGKALFVNADITNADQVDKLIQETVDNLGGVDILVNNAGITKDTLLVRMSDADWDRVLNVNLKGVFLCTRSALRPMLRRRWGRIINIASVIGIIGNAGQANYAAAKAGVIGLTKSTAQEVASRGITVNAIAPGFIDTDLTTQLPENLKQEILQRIPLGYFGTPEDVAHAVAFLVSHEAKYITGNVLRVDGGMVMV